MLSLSAGFMLNLRAKQTFSFSDETMTPTKINLSKRCLLLLDYSQMQESMIVILMTGDVAQWLEHGTSNPQTLGLIPWRGRVNERLFLSLRVSSCARQICSCLTPLSVYDTPPNLCGR